MKPPIILVDEYDNPVGTGYRESIDHTKDIYRSAALWIADSAGRILLAQRKLTKTKDPGMWGPAVAGTVEVGETYESNIYKEAEEEIGLTDTAFLVGEKQVQISPRKHFIQWFTCTLDRSIESFVLQEDEVEQLAWADKEDLKRDIQLYPDRYVPALRKGLSYLD